MLECFRTRWRPENQKFNRPWRSGAKAIGVRGYRIAATVAKAGEAPPRNLIGAARAFARSGYDATNMDQIAHECGIGHKYSASSIIIFAARRKFSPRSATDAVSRLIERLTAIAARSGQRSRVGSAQAAVSSVVARIFDEGGTLRAYVGGARVAQSGESQSAFEPWAGVTKRCSRISCVVESTRKISLRGDPKLSDLRDPARRLYGRHSSGIARAANGSRIGLSSRSPNNWLEACVNLSPTPSVESTNLLTDQRNAPPPHSGAARFLRDDCSGSLLSPIRGLRGITLLAPLFYRCVEGVDPRRIGVSAEASVDSFAEVTLVVVVARRAVLQEARRDHGESLDFRDPLRLRFLGWLCVAKPLVSSPR